MTEKGTLKAPLADAQREAINTTLPTKEKSCYSSQSKGTTDSRYSTLPKLTNTPIPASPATRNKLLQKKQGIHNEEAGDHGILKHVHTSHTRLGRSSTRAYGLVRYHSDELIKNHIAQKSSNFERNLASKMKGERGYGDSGRPNQMENKRKTDLTQTPNDPCDNQDPQPYLFERGIHKNENICGPSDHSNYKRKGSSKK